MSPAAGRYAGENAMTPTLEKHITAKIKKFLESIPDSMYIKIHGGPMQTAGLPDIFFFVKVKQVGDRGSYGDYVNEVTKCFAFEVKRPGNKATTLQLIKLAALRKVGFMACVVYSVDDVKVAMTAEGVIV